MIDRDTEIVLKIRAALKTRLGEDRYDLWLGGATRIAADAHRVQISSPTSFGVDRLRKSLLTEIRTVAQETIGPDAAVEFTVDPCLAVAARSTESTAVVDHRVATGDLVPSPLVPRTEPVAAAGRPCAAGFVPVGRRFATLDRFVVGPSNQLGHHAARMVVQQPGEVTPLFLHGPTGVGKTHLLEGVWSAMRRMGGRRIVYLSAEQFTTYFLQALRGSGLPSFRQKYRAVDLLVVDDVQFFAGKQATIVELLHTLDALLRESRQVVLAADRPPAELRDLGADFATRVAGGLVCGLQPLDMDTRCRLLRDLADRRGLVLGEPVVEYIAAHAPGDGRQLAGALNRLWASSVSLGETPSLRLAEATVAELFPQSCAVVRLDDIQRVVCHEFGIEPETLRSDRRARQVSHPRMLAMWLARKHTRAALTEISEFFGRRSHSTVVSAQNKVERWVHDGHAVQCSRRACDIREVVQRLERRLRA